MRKITLYIFFLFTIPVLGQTTYNITDPGDIEGLTLVAGDVVILADGTYSSDGRLKIFET